MLNTTSSCCPATARVFFLLLSAALMLALLAIPACKSGKGSSREYTLITGADFGLGVKFGQSAAQVEQVLGTPDGRRERQSGLMKESYWVARDPAAEPGAVPPEPGLLDPQLTLTFVDDKLVQVYNAYHVEEASALVPPNIAEPLTGVKIGARRSDILTALGKPALAGKAQDEWRFTGEDGTAVGIKAIYAHVDAANTDLATSVTVSFFGNTAQSRGEQYDKQQKANDALHGK